MKLAYTVAAIGLCAATPGLATGGYQCRPANGAGPVLTMAVGHTVSAALISATLKDGKRIFSTQGTKPALAVGQSWIDDRYLWLDLTDANSVRHEARLRTAFQPKLRGRPATGTLVRGGKTYRVRCVEA